MKFLLLIKGFPLFVYIETVEGNANRADLGKVIRTGS